MKTAYRSPRGPRYQHVFFDRRGSSGRTDHALWCPPTLKSSQDLLALEAQLPTEWSFLRWLFAKAGLDATCYRPETLQRRMNACLRALHVSNLTDARILLERDRSKVATAISALVIGVTSFFRDDGVFEQLARTVIPALPRPPQRRRIWSVGCSDGEELYSVAILLTEAGQLQNAELLGTDCRAPAIAHAREGSYEASALRSIPCEWWDKYFLKQGVRLRVAPELRTATQWRAADVTQVAEPGRWDLILCRNMAMYLRPHVASALWARFENALSPGGFLVLGKAERPIGARRLSLVTPCIYRRDNG